MSDEAKTWPLGAPKRPEPVKHDVRWYGVPGKPWLEQSNETPPRLRTRPYMPGYRP